MRWPKFIDDMKFPDFLALYIITICASTWIIILCFDFHDSTHVAEIRTGSLAIVFAVVGFYYGASQGSKRKDEVIQDMAATNAKKDEIMKTMTQDAKDLAKPTIPPKVDVTIKDAKDESENILGKES
jgi:hypothetical protein